MILNIWNDPEEEMERTAIDHYLDDLSDCGLLDGYYESIKEGTMTIDHLTTIMGKDLRCRYDVNKDSEDNMRYLLQEFKERVSGIDVNMAENIWQVQS